MPQFFQPLQLLPVALPPERGLKGSEACAVLQLRKLLLDMRPSEAAASTLNMFYIFIAVLFQTQIQTNVHSWGYILMDTLLAQA